LIVGSELAGYRVEQVLGRGGMSVVYRAYDPRLKRAVALKLMAPDLAEDESFRSRFLRECELAASLEHPNVVPIHDVGDDDGQLFLVMRLVDGSDLKALLRSEGALTPARALAIVSQVGSALDAAHVAGLVHRDVKPSNVLLDEHEHVYLADFGLTKRLTDREGSMPQAGSMGTLDYVAPEQIRGEDVDGRADIYAVGCLFYECLTGKPPYVYASDIAVLFAHLEEEPPAVDRLEDVLPRALAKDPGERFGTCRELVDEARGALGIAEPRRSRWPVAVAGVGVAFVCAALLAFVLAQGGSGGARKVAGNAVAVIDPHTNRLVGQVPVGARPEGIAAGSGSLWVANLDDQTISRVAPGTSAVVRTLSVVDTPTGIVSSRGVVWVVGSDPTRSTVSVRRIDPQFNVVALKSRIANVVPGEAGSVATDGNRVWVAPSFGLLSRLDPRTARVVQRIDPNAGVTDLAIGSDAVWVTDSEAGTVTRIDGRGRLTAIPVGPGPAGIAIGADGIWVADSLADEVTRIDPRTRRVVTTIPVGHAPTGVAVGTGSVWVANSQDGTVSRINPASNTVAKTIDVGGSPQQIVIADGRAWVTVQPLTSTAGAEASSGGTARLTATGEGFAEGINPAWLEVRYATCAMLVNYPDKAGPAGSRLVPEVSETLPARSPDGKTYTFAIRRGFRFSPPSNQPVTAQTFKYTLEWYLKGGTSELDDVVGARAYATGKAAHVAGIVARGNKLIIRLVKPVPDLPARLATDFVGCAVPLDTPSNATPGTIPSAGPYYIASYNPRQGAVLERNPNYRGSRPHHLARIVLSLGVSRQQAVVEVESGAADYASDGVPLSDAPQLAARYGARSPAAERGHQQYFVEHFPTLDFLVLNTHRPLFRDVRLRKAVNYAIDRRALTALGGLIERGSTPTDQYLPPGMPGFKPVRIYPLRPDLSKARRLAGGKPRTAVLYTFNDSYGAQFGQIVKAELRAIGIHVRIKQFSAQALFARVGSGASGNEPYDLGFFGWIGDYLDPSDFLNALLEGKVLPSFDDPVYKRKLAEAAALSGARRYLAYQELDSDLVRNAAPWVAFGNEVDHEFFSARMGCQIYQPIYKIDLAALCIRKR
jgi:YVTN family beta-propeller protein